MAQEEVKNTIESKEVKVEVKPEVVSELKPEVKAEVKPEVKPVLNSNPNDRRGQSMRRPMRGQRDRKQFARKDRDNEFEKRIVSIRRVSRTYSGGKRMRLSVCLVVGDKKGKVGIAVAKGSDVISAEAKAYNKAKKNMVQVKLNGRTISHQIFYKKAAARIMLRPASPGTGVIAGASLRAVLEVVGIEDILTKVIGSNNSINNAYACIEALQSLKQAS